MIAFLRIAKKQLRQSNYKFRLGAIVAKGSGLIASGHNSVKRLNGNIVGSEHAETAALRKAGARAKNATLLVVRENKSGNLVISKPCPMCQEKIKQAGIKTVIYVSSNGKMSFYRP